jgi:hypothetical protein
MRSTLLSSWNRGQRVIVNLSTAIHSLRWILLRLLLALPSQFEETPVHQSKGNIVRRGNRLECYTIFVLILFRAVLRPHLWNVRQRV